MALQTFRTIMKIIAGVVVMSVYLFQVNNKLQTGVLTMEGFQPLAQMMLLYIGIGIVVTIVVEIVSHILFSIGVAVKEGIKNEEVDDKEIESMIKQETVEDEMSKLIDLKTMRVGYVVTGIGFLASFIILALGHPVFTILNVLFVSCLVASILEGFAKIFYYKKGI